jgi:exodeoxyribonuclease-3
MRIINFSADGIESAAQKGFFDWLSSQDADFVCIQDLRACEDELRDPVFFPKGFHAYFLDAPDRSNGVAIYTRRLPKAIMFGLGFHEFDHEARYIQADFPEISIGSLLAPQALAGDMLSQKRKTAFLELLYAHLAKISNKRRDFVFAGNWQIAHSEEDVAAAPLEGTPGFLLPERRWLDDACHRLGYVDAFRVANRDNDEFSWWPETSPAAGWRVDFQLVSAGLRHKVEYAMIYKKQRFSSHAPVIIDYDFPMEEEEGF